MLTHYFASRCYDSCVSITYSLAHIQVRVQCTGAMNEATISLRATAPPKKIAGKPKVRTGCLTCRRVCGATITNQRADSARYRRVKCDEQRPSCKRCSIRGRACEWDTKGQKGPLKFQLILPNPDNVYFDNNLDHMYYSTFSSIMIPGLSSKFLNNEFLVSV